MSAPSCELNHGRTQSKALERRCAARDAQHPARLRQQTDWAYHPAGERAIENPGRRFWYADRDVPPGADPGSNRLRRSRRFADRRRSRAGWLPARFDRL